jgi:hypothetical protein
VLSSADGVVLVLDSQAAALPRNLECVKDLLEHLKANGLSVDIPIVVQLNKRDLPTAMPPSVLLAETGLTGRPFIEASASTGAGVFETLREVTRVVLEKVRSQARTKGSDLKTGDHSGLDGNTLYKEIAGSDAAPAKNETKAAAAKKEEAPSPAPAPPSVGTKRTASGTGASPASARANGSASASPASSVPSSQPQSIGAPVSSATPAQLNELIAAHRTLARRLDQIEVNVAKSVERALADLERRVLGRLGEIVENTKEIRDRSESSGASGREGLGELRASIAELERKLKEDAASRAELTRRAIETATRPITATAESSTKSLEKIHAVDDAMRTATAVLQDLSRQMHDRNGNVDTAIMGLAERSNVVESRLREVTELYADMVSDAKKSKSWWR